MEEETLIYFGSAVKALGDGQVEGWLVQFGGPDQPDLVGEWFDAKTEFGFVEEHEVPVFYQHGMDQTIGKKQIGRGKVQRRDAGLWITAQLDLRDEYIKHLYEQGIIQKEAMGWSSGAVSHLTQRDAKGRIAQWITGEASITPTPAEWRNVALPLKSLVAVDEPEADSAEAQKSADHGGETVEKIEVLNSFEGEQIMSEPQTDPRVDQLAEDFKSLSASVNRVLAFLETEPGQSLGYVTADGGKADPNTKSFGDYLLAVQRRDVKRLAAVYDIKDLSTTDLTSGGATVPTGYSSRLLEVAGTMSQIINRVERVPVGNMQSGTYPSLDQYFTPTANSGQTPFAGRVKATTTAEGAAYTETEPAFTDITWRVRKIGGYTEVNNELIKFSPLAIENILMRLFAISIAAEKEHQILNGNGSTEYLGIRNCPAVINVSPDNNNEFDYLDMLEMLSKHISVGGQPVFIIHKSMLLDIGTFEIGTSGAGVPTTSLAGASGLGVMPGTNIPIIESLHLPQANSSGCVVLADLSGYLCFESGGLSIAYSEHAAFTSGKGTWRFEEYSDGQPWVKDQIIHPDGSYEVSPFVVFND